MSSNYHTPIVTGASNAATTWNNPMAEMDEAIADRAAEIASERAGRIAATGALQQAIDDLAIAAVASSGVGTTTLSANANGGATTITVASISGFTNGDYITILLDSGAIHATTIDGAPAGSTITLDDAIPGSATPAATSGNAVSKSLVEIALARAGAPYGNSYVPTLPTTIEHTSAKIYNIKRYGAASTATPTANTTAVQAAIDAASAAGGTVVVPPGEAFEVLDEINIKSNTKFVIEPGATIKFSDTDPPTSHPNNQSASMGSWVFYADGADNWQLLNYGTIDANLTTHLDPDVRGTHCIRIEDCENFFVHLGYVTDGNVGCAVTNSSYGTVAHGWSDDSASNMDGLLLAENCYGCLFDDLKTIDVSETVDANGHNRYCTFSNLVGVNCSDEVIDLSQSENCIIRNVLIINGANDGIAINGSSGQRYSTDVSPPTGSNNILVSGVRGYVANADSEKLIAVNAGYNVAADDEFTVWNLTIENVVCAGAYYGIFVDIGAYTDTNPIKNLTIRNCAFDGVTRDHIRIEGVSGNEHGIFLDNIYCDDSTAFNKIYIENAQNIHLNRIVIPDAGTAATAIHLNACDEVTMAHCTLKGGATPNASSGHGLTIQGSCNRVWIHHCLFENFDGASKGAILLTQASANLISDVWIDHCYFEDNKYICYDATTAMARIILDHCTGISNTNLVRTPSEYKIIRLFGEDAPGITFADADATPSVKGEFGWYNTANTGATTITAFDDGYDGQVIVVYIGDANTTLQDSGGGSSLVLAGSANWTPAATDNITLRRRGGVWYEESRSDNS